MAFSFLRPDNIVDRYEKAKEHTEKLTQPFQEFERIARNKPLSSIGKGLPKVTDGTSASIIRKSPKRVIQQLPTGVVKATPSTEWIAIIAQSELTNKILPHSNKEYDFIQKCWSLVEKGLTFGSGFSYTPFLRNGEYFCPDMLTPYWGDVFLQPGKNSLYDCDYVFIRVHWQPEQIEDLISKERARARRAKEQNFEYESTWDLASLRQVSKSLATKDQSATTPSEKERGVNTESIELVMGFQVGVGAKFYLFSPSEKVVVRTKANRDPRGKMPVDCFYGDIDGSNPLGRSIIDLIGPLQNLMDTDMQLYMFNRTLMLAPPVFARGVKKNQVIWKPNALIVGDNENAEVTPLKIDTTAIAAYPQLYGLQKSQLLNLVSSPDTSISQDVGNPGFSKTDAGVKQQAANISVDDNFLRRMFEAWFQHWAEGALNIHFSEHRGAMRIELDDEAVARLKKLAQENRFDITKLEGNTVIFDFDKEEIPPLSFRVDASSSKTRTDAEQLDALTGVVSLIDKSPTMQAVAPKEKIAELYNAIIRVSGLDKPQDVMIDMDQFNASLNEQKQQEALAAEQEAEAQKTAAAASAKPPSMSINYKDAPEDIKRQMEASEGFMPSNMISPVQQQADHNDRQLEMQREQAVNRQPSPPAEVPKEQPAPPTQPQQSDDVDAQLQQVLGALGLDQEIIDEAIAMADRGIPADEIIEAITGGKS